MGIAEQLDQLTTEEAQVEGINARRKPIVQAVPQGGVYAVVLVKLSRLPIDAAEKEGLEAGFNVVAGVSQSKIKAVAECPTVAGYDAAIVGGVGFRFTKTG